MLPGPNLRPDGAWREEGGEHREELEPSWLFGVLALYRPALSCKRARSLVGGPDSI